MMKIDPKVGYGILIVIFIVVIVLLAIYCCIDQFENSSPLVFTKELPAMPKQCSPWYGCNWQTTPCKTNQDCESFRRCDEGKCVIPEKK